MEARPAGCILCPMDGETSTPVDGAETVATPTPTPAWWKRLLFALIPLLLLVPLVEGSFRLAGLGRPAPRPPTSREFTELTKTAPDGREAVYRENLYVGKRIHLNADNYRDWLYHEDEREGALRIVGLGDSYTFGDGLDPDETWLRQLGARVSESITDRKIRTLNFGRRGANTHEQLAILEEDVLRHAPDLVVLGFTVFNDAETKEYRERTTGEHKARAKKTTWSLAQWLNTHSYAVHFVVKILRRKRNQTAMRVHIGGQYADDAPGLIECRAALASIAQTCRERKLPLVLVIFPSHHKDPFLNDFAKTEFAEAHAKIRSALSDYPEVPVVDMADHLSDFQGQVIWIPGDGHPDARYAERVGEVTAPVAVELLSR